MIDNNGRNIDYIRISVTDRCNLRCVYCMPEEGIESVPHKDILSFDEITRTVKLMSGLGIKKVKLTGGEPLVRRGLSELIRQLKENGDTEEITLTTNGVLLEEQYDALKQAGIDGINISLDTTDRDAYKRITRRDMFDKVMNSVEYALKDGTVPLKINCVPFDSEMKTVRELAGFAKNHPIHVRFIEMMPIGQGRKFDYISENDILNELEKEYGTARLVEQVLGNGPCHYFSFDGFEGNIGFISAISHKFCSKCNRIRLTAQGFLKTCLNYDMGIDLKGMLRDGTGDAVIAHKIEEAVRNKPDGHAFTGAEGERTEKRNMFQIGG